jgi:two-component system cell cycle sensor histidine kinase/response regulator CckA
VDRVSRTILTGTETILLVEDSEPLRELGREFLETAGYNVLEAGDGISAIELAEKYDGTIHALISDVILPALSGSDLAKKLLVRRPAMKVLYVSGYPGEMLSHQGVLKTGITLLQKPYTQQALLHKLRELLDGRTTGSDSTISKEE